MGARVGYYLGSSVSAHIRKDSVLSGRTVLSLREQEAGAKADKTQGFKSCPDPLVVVVEVQPS